MMQRVLGGRMARCVVLAVVCASVGAMPAAGQYLGGGTKNAVETQIADLDAMRDKFLSLAEAFPTALYAWRPMEGVRSVRDVMALMAAECVLFPPMWGVDGAEWVADGDFRGELGRRSALSRDELIGEWRRGFDHLVGVVSGFSDEERAQHVEFFGLTVDLTTAVGLMANDMHEHLGQSIAYARMNQIVPPRNR